MTVNQKHSKRSGQDTLLWCLVVVFCFGGIIANHHFSAIDVSIRAIAGLGLFLMMLLIAYSTGQGKQFVKFAKESRHELRKVVWPTRDEAVKNTVMVAIIVAIMSVFLWGVDALIAWGISHFVQ